MALKIWYRRDSKILCLSTWCEDTVTVNVIQRCCVSYSKMLCLSTWCEYMESTWFNLSCIILRWFVPRKQCQFDTAPCRHNVSVSWLIIRRLCSYVAGKTVQVWYCAIKASYVLWLVVNGPSAKQYVRLWSEYWGIECGLICYISAVDGPVLLLSMSEIYGAHDTLTSESKSRHSTLFQAEASHNTRREPVWHSEK